MTKLFALNFAFYFTIFPLLAHCTMSLYACKKFDLNFKDKKTAVLLQPPEFKFIFGRYLKPTAWSISRWFGKAKLEL